MQSQLPSCICLRDPNLNSMGQKHMHVCQDFYSFSPQGDCACGCRKEKALNRCMLGVQGIRQCMGGGLRHLWTRRMATTSLHFSSLDTCIILRLMLRLLRLTGWQCRRTAAHQRVLTPVVAPEDSQIRHCKLGGPNRNRSPTIAKCAPSPPLIPYTEVSAKSLPLGLNRWTGGRA